MSGGLSDDKISFHDDESFNGAIARWATKAWVERIKDITCAAGVTSGGRQTASAATTQQLIHLANEMEIDPQDLIKRSIPKVVGNISSNGESNFYGLVLPTTLIEKRIRRVAPEALKIAPYHRAIWDLRLFPACLETGQILITHCANPQCQGPSLSWRQTIGVDLCEHCACDLKAAHTPSLPVELLAGLRAAARLFIPDQRAEALEELPARLLGGNGQLAAELLQRLLPFVVPALSKFRNGLHKADPVELATGVAGSWNLIKSWPRSFEELAVERLNRRKALHDDGNERQTLRFITGKLTNSYSGELFEVSKELRQSIDQRGPCEQAVQARSIQIKDACKETGTNTGTLAILRREGKLKSNLTMDVLGRLQPMLDRAEIGIVAADIKQRLGLGSVASRLGIALEGASQLSDMGYLDEISHPFFLARYGDPQFRIGSFEKILADLHAQSSANLGEDTLSLPIAIKVIGARFKPWGPLFGTFIDGGIPFQLKEGRGPLVRRITVRRKCLPDIAALEHAASPEATRQLAEQLSKIDSMEVLNLSPRSGTDLFADIPTYARCRKKTISADTVFSLAQAHITVGELALRRNVTMARARRDAKLVEIPHLGPCGFCRAAAEATYFS